MKKTLYTLAVNNWCPEVTDITFKLMERYADKIDADFHVISERKSPGRYITYEKFQIWELMRQHGDEWSIFMDADTLVHPDFFDVTAVLPREATCSGYANDFTPIRFRPDYCTQRDGRFMGKGSWFVVCSDWTRDIWRPLGYDSIDPTYDQCIKDIFPTDEEVKRIGKTPESLIDDYIVSRNIAKYGLKHILLSKLCEDLKIPVGVETNIQDLNGQIQRTVSPYLQHDYNAIDKLVWIEKTLKFWGVSV